MSAPSPALLDSSVVIHLDRIPTSALPEESAICAVTLAELAAGPCGFRERQLEGRYTHVIAALLAEGFRASEAVVERALRALVEAPHRFG